MPINRAGESIYFSAADGARWRVHDCTFAGGRFTRCATTPSAKATSRVFVAANGVKKSYRFTKGEIHELSESRLEAQLRGAGYLATAQYDPSEREAR